MSWEPDARTARAAFLPCCVALAFLRWRVRPAVFVHPRYVRACHAGKRAARSVLAEGSAHTRLRRARGYPVAEQAAVVATAYPHGGTWPRSASGASAGESTRIDSSHRSMALAAHSSHGDSESLYGVRRSLLRRESSASSTPTVRSTHGRRRCTALAAGNRSVIIWSRSPAGFGVLLIASGLYLWWPRDGRGVSGKPCFLPSRSSDRGGGAILHSGDRGLGRSSAVVLPRYPGWPGHRSGAAGGARPNVELFAGRDGSNAPLAAGYPRIGLNHGAHHEIPWAVESKRPCRLQVPSTAQRE